MKLLCEELSFDEKLHLASFSMQPSFQILKKMMADACSQATAEVIKLDPVSDGYVNKLQSLQFIARATNDFSSTLLKSIIVHSDAAAMEEQEAKEEQEMKLKNKLVSQYRTNKK